MIKGQNLGRLIELAFGYVSVGTEQEANQVHDQAAKLATETSPFNRRLELIDHIWGWNNGNGHNYPKNWASVLQFLSTRQTALEPSRAGNQ